MTRDNSLGDGAYYPMEDYASFLRRIGVILIDTTVLVVLLIAIGVFVITLLELFSVSLDYDPSGVILLIWLFCTWLYLVPLKRSRFRTIGYRLLGLMIVDCKGERPSLLRMTFRMLLWIFGPMNTLLDLLWLGADTEGQSLRDCIASTYVAATVRSPSVLHRCISRGTTLLD